MTSTSFHWTSEYDEQVCHIGIINDPYMVSTVLNCPVKDDTSY